MLPRGQVENSPQRVFRPQLRHNFSGGNAGLVRLIGREADRAHAGMAAAAVTLADLCEIHHLGRVGLGPGIRTNRDLGAEAGFREANRISGLGMEIVRDELVIAIQRQIGEVEEDGAVALFGALADQGNGLWILDAARAGAVGDRPQKAG